MFLYLRSLERGDGVRHVDQVGLVDEAWLGNGLVRVYVCVGKSAQKPQGRQNKQEAKRKEGPQTSTH